MNKRMLLLVLGWTCLAISLLALLFSIRAAYYSGRMLELYGGFGLEAYISWSIFAIYCMPAFFLVSPL